MITFDCPNTEAAPDRFAPEYEPRPEELCHNDAITRDDVHGVALLPEHYARYLPIFHRYHSGIRIQTIEYHGDPPRRKYGSKPKTTTKLPPPPTFTPTHEEAMNKEFYTEPELAEKLGISTATVASWRKTEKIPPKCLVPDSRPISFYAEKIDDWVASDKAPVPRARTTPAKPSKQADMPHKESVASIQSDHVVGDLLREYWKEGSRAVDVLLMPSETGMLIRDHVDAAIRFVHRRLREADSRRPVLQERPENFTSDRPGE